MESAENNSAAKRQKVETYQPESLSESTDHSSAVEVAKLTTDQDAGTHGLHIPSELAEKLSRITETKPYAVQRALANEAKLSHLKTLCIRNLPPWTVAADIRDVITRLSTVGLESMFSMAHAGQQIITNIQVARDPETQKCTGYALVEFVEHAVAAEILITLPGPNFRLTGSNRVLSLQWAQVPINPSSVLDNYHLYIGNMRPGLSDRSVLNILKTFHPAVASVRLVPTEVLGPAPEYIEESAAAVIEEDDLTNEIGRIGTSTSFYCAASCYKEPEVPPHIPATIKCGERQWSCGFIRLSEDNATHWKFVLRVLRNKINGEAGKCLRRHPFTPEAAAAPDDAPHRTNAIVLRPIFGRFDTKSAFGYKYTGSNFPTAGTRKKPGPTGGNFPQPSALVPTATVHHAEPENPLGPQNKTSLFISNLSDETTDEDVAFLLSPFGAVLSARVAFMKHAAFVDMGDFRSVLASLSHLRGTTFKKNKLQFDWGRERPMMAPVLRQIDTESPYHRLALQQEKHYAWEWVQSMQPIARPIDVPNNIEEKIVIDDNESKSYWLACLCDSLPKSPNMKQSQNDMITQT